MSFRTAVSILLLALGLAACDSVAGVSMFTPKSTAYDGVWVGQLTVGLKTDKCYVSRGGVRLRIVGGRLNGVVRFQEGEGDISGVLDDKGVVQLVKVNNSYDGTDVALEGQFGESTASGTWNNGFCTGDWELKKAR
ncbi:hypothetical protein HH303_07395 [Rhodospirillaceae bacterium KN72]|uniref:Lipoprotein n=1 Tax=Pacificispira spongiicola TaxID=2729598 RepID=A0A7Y0DZ58_9PROT|nr:hypothetical protein [Pacificispira spongiicola]NMM44297.1 hypothetical protein [Pacificispira spongiicola]